MRIQVQFRSILLVKHGACFTMYTITYQSSSFILLRCPASKLFMYLWVQFILSVLLELPWYVNISHCVIIKVSTNVINFYSILHWFIPEMYFFFNFVDTQVKLHVYLICPLQNTHIQVKLCFCVMQGTYLP